MPVYDFTGLADGAAWPTPFQNYTTWGKGVASVQNQQGELKTGALGNWNWEDQCRVNYQTTPANVEVVYTMNIVSADCVPNLIMRNAGNSGDSEAQRMEIKHNGSTVQIQEALDGTLHQIGTVSFDGFAAPFKVRCQVQGMAFKIKFWAASEAEPAAWSRELTLTRVGAAGSFGYFLVGGQAAESKTVRVDDILVQDLTGFTRSVTLTAPATVAGTVGQAVSAQLSATVNDMTSVAYSATGLPPGVSLNATSGAVTGTPTTAGTYTTTFTATGATGATDSKTTTFTVGSAAGTVTLTAPKTARGQVGIPVSGVTLTSTTSNGSTVSYSATGLPPGLSLGAGTGTVTGTPTMAGTYTTTFTATSGTGATHNLTTTWRVTPAQTAVTVDYPSTASGRVGQAITPFGPTTTTNEVPTGEQFPDARWPSWEVGMYLPIWSDNPDAASIDDVPAGVNTLRLAFLYQGVSGGGPLHMVAYGRDGQSGFVSKLAAWRNADQNRRVIVSIGGEGYPIDLSDTAARVADMATVYNTIGGYDAWDFDIEAGPAYTTEQIMSFARGVYAELGVGFTMVPFGTVVEQFLPIAVAGHQERLLVAYGQQFYSSDVDWGGVSYRMNQAIDAGLPTSKLSVGMMVASDATGWTNAECVTIMQQAQAAYQLRRAYLWEAARPGAAQWATDMHALLHTKVEEFTVTGLPAGLTLNPDTGQVTGAPSAASTATATFTGTSTTGASASDTVTFNIAEAPTVTLNAPATAAGRVGSPVSMQLTSSTNDGATVTYSATGLPPGLSLNATTGAVTGTPTTAGTPTTTFTATSSSGPTASKQTAWTISPAPTVTLTAPATAAGRVGVPLTGYQLTSTTNDGATVTYSVTGLAPGLTLNATTGAIGGTPTLAGAYTANWTATSSSGATQTKPTDFTIAPAATVTLNAPAAYAGHIATPVSMQLASSTNDGATVTYSADTLPAGLTLNATTGAVTGTPTHVGTTTTTFTATSSSGPTANQQTTWTITEPVYTPPVKRWSPPTRGWTYFATTIHGDGTETLLAPSLPLKGVTVVDPVSAPPEISFDLTPEIRRLQRPDGKPLIRARSTAVYAMLDGQFRGGGIITRTSADGPTLKVLCGGLVSLIDGEPWTNSTIKYIGVDPADVIRTIWRYWQMHPLANIPLELPADLRTGAKVGTVEEPVLLANYATADLGEMFYDMLEAGSIDFRERHSWDQDGDQIRHRLELGYPRLGRRRADLSFHIGTNVLVPAVGFDQERYASEVLVLGAGEGDKMIRAHAYNPKADRLRRCKALPSKGIGRTPTAQLFAAKWVQNFMGDERDVEELAVIEHPAAPLFSWDPGDEVWLSGDSMWGGQIGMWVRILSTTVTPDQSATAVLKVARADKVI